jgi:phage replication-related protein YjqB (UPF0714/DUF867 family)
MNKWNEVWSLKVLINKRRITSKIIRQLILLESEFLYQQVAKDGEEEYVYVPGDISILLSAPHSTSHYRERIKTNNGFLEEDEYTGGIVRLVSRLTGAHAIYLRRKTNFDPNYLTSLPYKTKLEEIQKTQNIRIILDIHGMKEDRDFGIIIGTTDNDNSSCKTQLPIIKKSLQLHGFSENHLDKYMRYGINKDNLNASGEGTITNFSWNKLKIPAAQFEINSKIRIPLRRTWYSSLTKQYSGDKEKIVNLIYTLCYLVRQFA